MRITQTDSSSQSNIPQTETAADSVGKTTDNKGVVPTGTGKQLSEVNKNANPESATSLMGRNVGHGSKIATPDDFQPDIDQINYFDSIRQKIDTIPAFQVEGIQKGALKPALPVV